MVLGKLGGAAWLSGVQLALGVLPLFFFGLPRPAALAEALGGGVAVFCGCFVIGFRYSLRFPRKAFAAGEGNSGGIPLTQGLLLLALLGVVTGVPSLVAWAAGPLRPLALLALGALFAGLTKLALPRLGAALHAERERLVEGLG
jgi:hypothetical protein